MRKHLLPVMAGAVLVFSSYAFAQGRSEEARERTIELSSVPKPAVDAARKALGADPTEAKIIRGTRPQQYEVAVESGGKENAVHVRANGTIVKRETENESAEHERNERGGR
jgi:hypothetical protein